MKTTFSKMKQLLLLALLFTTGLNTASAQLCDASFSYISLGSDFYFENTSSGDLDGVFWNFGNGNSSTDMQGVYQNYPTPGTYTICLDIYGPGANPQDSIGCYDTHCEDIVIADAGSCYNAAQLDSNQNCFASTFPMEVCGCDGVTYTNSCEAYFWYGVTSWSSGACDTSGTGGNCYNPAQVDTMIACPSVYDPVCGCDGMTYSNECEAYYWYGVTSWSLGTCDSTSVNCPADASFNFSVATDSVSGLTVVTVNSNYSALVDSAYFWTFGDGSYGFDANEIHVYPSAGMYNICLEVWDIDPATGLYCMDYHCETISAGNGSNPIDSCGLVGDCVFPGDADFNFICDNFDVLPVGIHYGDSGYFRPMASNDWYGQYSDNWGYQTIDGNDVKHVDCNGDGLVGNNDMDAISLNYNRIHNGVMPLRTEDAPEIYLVFPEDSMFLEPNGSNLTFVADIMVGSDAAIPQELYGFAFSLSYEADIIEPGSILVNYTGENWFGPANDVLQLVYDMDSVGQVDMAYSRTDQVSINGWGRIATIQFTIRDDIIGRSVFNEIPFPVEIHRIKAVTADGTQVPYNGMTSTMVLLTEESTGIVEPLETMVTVYPNPATDVLNIQSEGIAMSRIVLHNALGQEVMNIQPQGVTQRLNSSQLAAGIYLISIHTEQGILNKKVVIK